MPVKWDVDPSEAPEDSGASLHAAGHPALITAVLWPHRSLPRRGMVAIIGFAFLMIMIPALPLLGTPALWGLLPFTLGAVWLLWFLLERSYASGRLREDLRLWSDRIEIVRTDPGRHERRWSANPFWVRVTLRPTGGPVESYLTLCGNGREVELGAFLAPDERERLHDELSSLLARLARKGR